MTAEELVGDLLTSDPNEDEDAAIARITLVKAKPSVESDLGGHLKLRSQISRDGVNPRGMASAINHVSPLPKNHYNEVLSPSRILESSPLEQDEDTPAALENPFEVASGGGRGQDEFYHNLEDNNQEF